MATLTVKLFGRFSICCEDQPAAALNTRRAREVLSYLILHPDRPHRREKLADLLWEETPPAQARKYLRQALWQIQTALQREHERDAVQPLEVDQGWIQLRGCSRLQVDVDQFQSATRDCHGISGPGLDTVQYQRLKNAVHLYRGDLLEGWEHEWCLFERERLLNELLHALAKLVTNCLARHDCERGLEYARRILAVDPAHEQVHCHIMRLHMLAGNRTQALRVYQSCERVLMRELGVQPSQTTRALHESIRQGRSDGVWSGFDHTDSPVHGSLRELARHRLPILADDLARAQSDLAGIEARLRQELGQIDR